MSTRCQPINHTQRKRHHVGKLKGSFLLKACKWTLSPLHEKGTLYREQMGWWPCDKPPRAARRREDRRSSCREHAPWLEFASLDVTSKPGTNRPACFLPWLWGMWSVSHSLQVRADSKELPLTLTWGILLSLPSPRTSCDSSPVPGALWTLFYVTDHHAGYKAGTEVISLSVKYSVSNWGWERERQTSKQASKRKTGSRTQSWAGNEIQVFSHGRNTSYFPQVEYTALSL